MLFVKAPVNQAEEVKLALMQANLLDVSIKVEREDDFIYFPVKQFVAGYDVIERDAKKFLRPKTLTEALLGLLPDEVLKRLTTSYDIVGSIAIIEVEDDVQQYEEQIAQAVLQTHAHVTTVLKKADKHAGEFRTQKLAYLAGEDTRETVVHESGTRLLVDVEEVYFSVRLSTERLRIASLVKPHEDVLVMFSGAAPYVVVLAKKTKAHLIVGVEKNPVGHKYAVENVRMNKVKNAALYNADCKDMSFLPIQFDRILMPLPATSEEFLPSALSVAKNGATIHMYAFCREDEIPQVHENIKNRCAQAGFFPEILKTVKAGHHAPYVYRWCVDFIVKGLR